MTLVEFATTHTYRTVCAGSMMIGAVAGAIGCFAYLRKQSLSSDVISHSALPGVLGAFLFAVVVMGADGRSMPLLITGAVVSGTAAVLLANAIARASTIKIDTAMAVTLSLFFGLGMLLMQVIAQGSFPGKGGIQTYLFGNASVITLADLYTSAAIGAGALALMVLLWKEFALRTFDPEFCTALGFRARTIDALMFTLMAVATVIGVKSVGLVLMVAFVVTPPAAARQWVRSLPAMVAVSTLIGAVGSGVGAYLSVTLGKIPTGPLTVLTLFAIFVISMLVAPGRSIAAKALHRARARRALQRELVVGEEGA